MPTPITIYATEADIALYALGEAALEGVDPGKITAALVAASRLMDKELASQYALPLLGISVDLTMQTARVAAYIILTSTGYNPEAPRDDIYRLNYEDALKWAKSIGSGQGRPVGLIGSAAGQVAGQAASASIQSSSQRGFSEPGGVDGGVRRSGLSGGFVGD